MKIEVPEDLKKIGLDVSSMSPSDINKAIGATHAEIENIQENTRTLERAREVLITLALRQLPVGDAVE